MIRDVPLPDSLRARINAHQESFKTVAVTLPWETLDGKPTTVSLLLTREAEAAVMSNTFNAHVWKPALRKGRRAGDAGERHTRPSTHVCIRPSSFDAGKSVKALSVFRGHADPGFTLRVYRHLLPTSKDRTRRAIDRALDGTEPPSRPADGLEAKWRDVCAGQMGCVSYLTLK